MSFTRAALARSHAGYEFHSQMHDMLNAPGGLQKMTDFFVGLQVWGTPDHLSCGWPDMRPIDPRPR